MKRHGDQKDQEKIHEIKTTTADSDDADAAAVLVSVSLWHFSLSEEKENHRITKSGDKRYRTRGLMCIFVPFLDFGSFTNVRRVFWLPLFQE